MMSPSSDGLPGIGQILEPVFVQAIVSEGAVEALDKAVLHRLARRDVVPLDLALLLPAVQQARSAARLTLFIELAKIIPARGIM